MGCGNQPALNAIDDVKSEHFITSKPKGEHCISSNPCGADDGGWTSGAYSLSGSHIQGDFHSYPPDLNCLPDSKIDRNLNNIKSEMSEFCRESEMSYPEVNMRGLDYAIDGSNSVSSSCMMNTDVPSTDYGKSEVYMNFMSPWYETSTGYPIKEHGAEAKNSTLNMIQMSGNFSSSECKTSLLPLVYNFGKSGNKNDININPLSFSSPQKVDRNFLTLGIGSDTGIRPNSNFSTREISSTLEEDSSHCYNSVVRHSPKNPLNLTQSVGRAERQTSVGGLSSLPCSLASMMPTRDERGLIGDNGFGLNPIPSPGLQIPQANAQFNFSAKCFTSELDLTPLSLPFGSTLASSPIGGTQPGLMSTISRQQDYCREISMKDSSESSRNFLSDRHNQSSICHVQLGRLIPLTEGGQINAAVHFPQSVQPARSLTSIAEGTRTAASKIGSFAPSVHPVGHLDAHNVCPVEELGINLFHERNEVQNSKSGTSRPSAAGAFPKRLGLQPNDFVTSRTSSGPPPIHLASPLYPVRPSASTGQVIPAAKFDAKPRAAPSFSHPSLKRKATENPATARLGQQRKIFRQRLAPGQRQSIQTTPAPIPATLHIPSAVGQKQSIQSTRAPIPKTVHIPSAPLHVKWQGFDDERLEPSGEKCLLCKRDLSLTAEGLVLQPSAPPPIAVLPCGHTFHDHCLQIITPRDQLTTPPCIPCAIEFP